MPVLRIRLRISTLLVLIALTALALGAESIRRRRIYYQEKAEFHAWQVERYGESLDFRSQGADLSRSLGMAEAAARQHWHVELMAALFAYHVRMQRKYESAASHPWQAVPPDPPTPYDPFDYTPEEWEVLRQAYTWLPATLPK